MACSGVNGTPCSSSNRGVFQRELRGRPGDLPQAGIMGFRRGADTFRALQRAAGRENFRHCFQQAFHSEASNKAVHAPHEDGGYAEQAEQQRKGPANPRSCVVQNFVHGFPGQGCGIGLCDTRPRCLRLIREGREDLNLALAIASKRPVHVVGVNDIQDGKQYKGKHQKGEPQKEKVSLLSPPFIVRLPFKNGEREDALFFQAVQVGLYAPDIGIPAMRRAGMVRADGLPEIPGALIFLPQQPGRRIRIDAASRSMSSGAMPLRPVRQDGQC